LNTSTDHTLSPFHARWLAEVVRVREQSGQLMDDREAMARLSDAEMDVERRILQRARALAERDGSLQSLQQWRTQSRWLLIIFAVLAVLAGFSAALAVLGDGRSAVNIIWALGALLGLHLVMLLFWLFNMLYRGEAGGGLLGRSWMSLMQRIGGSRQATVARALMDISLQGRLSRWYLSAITHGLWTLTLGAVAVALILALSLRSYDFVWETTILSADVFVRFVQWSGHIPSWLGFSVPDADMVRLSGDGDAILAAQRDLLRRSWSSWLLGCLVVYGVVPRLLLLLFSLGWLAQRQRRMRLDLSVPYWAALARRLSPSSERGGITDPQSALLTVQPLVRDPTCDGDPVLLGHELRADTAWPPQVPAVVHAPAVVETREQRAAAGAMLAQRRPGRLLLACDARLSPDRGTLNWLAEMSAFCAQSRVWLLHTAEADAQRLASWQESLQAMGFTGGEVYSQAAPALMWLAPVAQGAH